MQTFGEGSGGGSWSVSIYNRGLAVVLRLYRQFNPVGTTNMPRTIQQAGDSKPINNNRSLLQRSRQTPIRLFSNRKMCA